MFFFDFLLNKTMEQLQGIEQIINSSASILNYLKTNKILNCFFLLFTLNSVNSCIHLKLKMQ